MKLLGEKEFVLFFTNVCFFMPSLKVTYVLTLYFTLYHFEMVVKVLDLNT